FQAFQSELHISYSQIFTYLACSLKYQFQYVEQRPHEHVSIALPFGSAIHSAIECYHLSIVENGVPYSLWQLQDLFEDRINAELDQRKIPILYKKQTPDRQSAIDMGKGMLKAFYEGIDMTGFEIVGVELPLTARLYSEEGRARDMLVTGIIDLLLKDQQGFIIAVDNKTAKNPYAQATVDEDLQLTSYAYLLASNKYVFPTADVYCRFDVMRKLKTPKFEQHYTIRTAEQRRRFAKLTGAVLAGIDARIFMPSKSWMCGDCQFAEACKDW
ncbi:MAG: PD-(D/E)XK nuclease family protein, partial [Desulfobacterium sp.]|nr:PD-(D/E)XK nuclease family protein [Desulfobacterium sp.]